MQNLKQKDFPDVAFIALSAEVMGDVSLGKGCSIWHTAVVRADVEKIIIGNYSNIQDGAILHGDRNQITIIEDYVTVGHRAVIHSAHIKKGCLIGIGAIVLNGVTIGEGSIIGAGCVVTKDVEPHSLMIGIPSRKVREVGVEEAEDLIEHARQYYQLALYHAGKSEQKGFTIE
jgi:carbonic anhydrase/acetyltransferase-like protein (isoleucine patch superfamily)